MVLLHLAKSLIPSDSLKHLRWLIPFLNCSLKTGHILQSRPNFCRAKPKTHPMQLQIFLVFMHHKMASALPDMTVADSSCGCCHPQAVSIPTCSGIAAYGNHPPPLACPLLLLLLLPTGSFFLSLTSTQGWIWNCTCRFVIADFISELNKHEL